MTQQKTALLVAVYGVMLVGLAIDKTSGGQSNGNGTESKHGSDSNVGINHERHGHSYSSALVYILGYPKYFNGGHGKRKGDSDELVNENSGAMGNNKGHKNEDEDMQGYKDSDEKESKNNTDEDETEIRKDEHETKIETEENGSNDKGANIINSGSDITNQDSGAITDITVHSEMTGNSNISTSISGDPSLINTTSSGNIGNITANKEVSNIDVSNSNEDADDGSGLDDNDGGNNSDEFDDDNDEKYIVDSTNEHSKEKESDNEQGSDDDNHSDVEDVDDDDSDGDKESNEDSNEIIEDDSTSNEESKESKSGGNGYERYHNRALSNRRYQDERTIHHGYKFHINRGYGNLGNSGYGSRGNFGNVREIRDSYYRGTNGYGRNSGGFVGGRYRSGNNGGHRPYWR